MAPHEYIAQVKSKDIFDPILSFQLANDFEVKQVLKAYLPEDKESKGYAALLQWHNIYHDAEQLNLLGRHSSSVRIGLVHWQVRYFRDSEELLTAISRLAVTYNINIVAGSMPVIHDDDLYNISYLCRRDSSVDSQAKIHPTPHEKRDWTMLGGDELKVFDTDFGKIGILICYDVEFPELSRLLAEQEMELIVVPFWTDTKNGYLRVRRCSQARAIENECYVAITGSVGNLPKIDNVDIQYGQSAVFSPSNFAFPHDAIVSETTPNTEMTLIVDLDFEKLKTLQNEGRCGIIWIAVAIFIRYNGWVRVRSKFTTIKKTNLIVFSHIMIVCRNFNLGLELMLIHIGAVGVGID